MKMKSEIEWLEDYIHKMQMISTCKGLPQDNVQMINANISVHQERLKQIINFSGEK